CIAGNDDRSVLVQVVYNSFRLFGLVTKFFWFPLVGNCVHPSFTLRLWFWLIRQLRLTRLPLPRTRCGGLPFHIAAHFQKCSGAERCRPGAERCRSRLSVWRGSRPRHGWNPQRQLFWRLAAAALRTGGGGCISDDGALHAGGIRRAFLCPSSFVSRYCSYIIGIFCLQCAGRRLYCCVGFCFSAIRVLSHYPVPCSEDSPFVTLSAKIVLFNSFSARRWGAGAEHGTDATAEASNSPALLFSNSSAGAQAAKAAKAGGGRSPPRRRGGPDGYAGAAGAAGTAVDGADAGEDGEAEYDDDDFDDEDAGAAEDEEGKDVEEEESLKDFDGLHGSVADLPDAVIRGGAPGAGLSTASHPAAAAVWEYGAEDGGGRAADGGISSGGGSGSGGDGDVDSSGEVSEEDIEVERSGAMHDDVRFQMVEAVEPP
ncbi:unnamed protein product, partial [Phaeothamnion confervicola]